MFNLIVIIPKFNTMLYEYYQIEGGMEGLDLHDNGKNVWQYNGTYGPDLFTAKAKKVILKHNPNEVSFNLQKSFY